MVKSGYRTVRVPVTVSTRKAIGFDALRDRWGDSPAVFGDDTLKICGHPVMERWEDDYMRALADIAVSRGGHVLEVGFGMGLSASHIQRGDIEGHTIIEANADVCREAARFAEHAHIPTVILQGFWEDVVATLPSGSFDGILFDTYPLVEEEVHRNHFAFFPHARRLLRPGGVLTYYSDESVWYSPEHLHRLHEAGFSSVDGRICAVRPPPDCAYWKQRSLLCPIVRA